MRLLLLIVVAAFGGAAPLFAQTPAVGDAIRLVERDIHIPAHPGPGVASVPFRFTSASDALVLAVDGATSWLQIRGERVGGATAVGWITRTYIASVIEAPEDPPELAWCPAKGSPNPHPSGRLRVATWNLANLHAVDGQAIFGGSDPSEQRFQVDYARIRCYIRMFDPDVLAVQEVDGPEALQRVVDPAVYSVHVSTRPNQPDMNGKQNTGFAFKKGLTVQTRPDVVSLDVSNGGLRHGARIDLTIGGQTLAFMSVHLKSGCFENSSAGSACTTLMQQLPKLEEWIDATAVATTPFVVLGDFNRRLTVPGDSFWTAIDDSQPVNADLTAITQDMPISCRDNEFTEFIDHIVFDKRATAFVDRSTFRHVTFRQADKPVWGHLSDHCPVVVDLFVP
jgi:endonuclease/exonuclease/phosphatase family metal-dependent hydrolase